MALVDLAEDRGIIIAAYIFTFFPWGMMYLRHFLRDCGCDDDLHKRRVFLIYSLSSIPAVAYMCFYIHLQRIAGNHQEMCLAIYGIMFVLFHIVKAIKLMVKGNDNASRGTDDLIMKV